MKVGDRVKKVGGSFEHTGTIVSVFNTTAGAERVVLEFDAPVSGMLHVYRPDQLGVLVDEKLVPAQVVQAFLDADEAFERAKHNKWGPPKVLHFEDRVVQERHAALMELRRAMGVPTGEVKPIKKPIAQPSPMARP